MESIINQEQEIQKLKDRLIKKEHKLDEMEISVEKLLLVMHGDKENGVKGMIEKVNEMHQIFTSSNFTVILLIKIFAGIGIIAGAIIGMIQLGKYLK